MISHRALRLLREKFQSRAVLAILQSFSLSLLGCGNGGNSLEDPPEGYPWLASEYQVTLTYEPETCVMLGSTPELAEEIVATVTQDGDQVKWIQKTDNGKWTLKGALCPVGDQFELRLQGTVRVRVHSDKEVCEASLAIPESENGCNLLSHADCASISDCLWLNESCIDNPPSDICQSDRALVLSIDNCILSGSATLLFTLNRSCNSDLYCQFELNFEATPSRQNAYAGDAGCVPEEAEEK